MCVCRGYKDGQEKIKKQAQRFRIYAFDDQGRVVREVTGGKDTITWTVKLANTKAAWYEFNNPLDMGEFVRAIPGKLRNNFFVGKERECLEIAPDEVSITGNGTNAAGKDSKYEMADVFWRPPNEVKVTLGRLETDNQGRLVVVPGGGAGAPAPPGTPIDNFADNDGWYDDWADGWVKAEVTLEDGSKVEVDPAWVACCGPDFAPEILPFVTLYDVVRDVMVNGKKKPLEEMPSGRLSFRGEIYPFFRRLGLMEWVSAASDLREGWIQTGDFLDPQYMKKLADPSPANQAFREKVFQQFRHPDEYKFYENDGEFKEKIQYKIPYMLGSGVNYDFSPAHWFAMPKLCFDILEQWSKGNFVDDLDVVTAAEKTGKFEDVPLGQQPMALTRAALDPLSGGAFHPGVELTWPMRQQHMYSDSEPYRIKIGNGEPVWKQVQKIGLQLTPAVAFEGATRKPGLSGECYTFFYDDPNSESPIGPQNPGGLTRWLGLPWHPDAFSCQMVAYSNDFPNAAWWPALLPIDVLPEYYFNQLSRHDLDDDSKLKFFNNRRLWSRGVTGVGYHVQGSYDDGLSRMITLWSHMGFVVKRPRPEGLSARLQAIIPAELFVETERGSMDLLTDDPPN